MADSLRLGGAILKVGDEIPLGDEISLEDEIPLGDEIISYQSYLRVIRILDPEGGRLSHSHSPTGR